METTKKRLDSVDVAKFVLSIMIVTIHLSPFPSLDPYIMPMLRVAVPLFFLISAFFFFGKYHAEITIEGKIGRLERYVKRNLQLYFFWLIVLLLPTLSYRKWFDAGLLMGIFHAMRDFVFGSTFIASWYIMASIIATVAIAVASRYLGNKCLVALSLVTYCACCLLSNYGNAPFVASHYDALYFAFQEGYNSFWVALFWVVAGKILAENKQKVLQLGKGYLWATFFVGVVIIYLEQITVLRGGWAVADDCYFGLAIVCVPLFLLIIRANVSCKMASFLRNASIVTYCLHATLNWLLVHFTFASAWHPFTIFAIVLALSWFLTAAIMHLEKCSRLSWLRYSH